MRGRLVAGKGPYACLVFMLLSACSAVLGIDDDDPQLGTGGKSGGGAAGGGATGGSSGAQSGGAASSSGGAASGGVSNPSAGSAGRVAVPPEGGAGGQPSAGAGGQGGAGADGPASGGKAPVVGMGGRNGTGGNEPTGGGPVGGFGGAPTAGAGGDAGAGGEAGWGGASSVCGDGVRDSGEACDDGNSVACGTCSANCGTETPLAPPRGTITVAVGSVLDGERFELNDGFGAVLFEFDNNEMLTSGEWAIPFAVGNSANTLRDAIIVAVNGAGGLGIIATSGGSGTVLLTNEHTGSKGNLPITDEVSSASFVHTGMSGGAGYDCAAGTGCFRDEDCVSSQCESGSCL